MILYYILGMVLSFFIEVTLVAKFIGVDSQDDEEFMSVLGLVGLASVFWPLSLPLSFAGFGGYAIIKYFDKDKK